MIRFIFWNSLISLICFLKPIKYFTLLKIKNNIFRETCYDINA